MTDPTSHEITEDAFAWGAGFDARMNNKHVNPYDHFEQPELAAAWLAGFQAAQLSKDRSGE